MKKLRVVCDADGIAANFFQALFDQHHSATGEQVHISQIKSWDMSKHVKNPVKLMSIFRQPGFFRYLDPIPGALAGLKKIMNDGHDVLIATHACTPHAASEKIDWFSRYASFIPSNKIWIGADKHELRGDVLIDDGAHNAEKQRQAVPDSLILTIAYPHNEHHVYDGRFGASEDYKEIDYRKAWEDIYQAIKKKAHS